MNITKSEWPILKALWEKSPQTLMELCESVGSKNGLSKHGLISLLKRMAAKNSITVRQTDERKYFYPAVCEQEAVRFETESLAKKVFGGSRLLLVSNIIKDEALSNEDIEELIELLRNAGGK